MRRSQHIDLASDWLDIVSDCFQMGRDMVSDCIINFNVASLWSAIIQCCLNMVSMLPRHGFDSSMPQNGQWSFVQSTSHDSQRMVSVCLDGYQLFLFELLVTYFGALICVL